MKFPTWALRGLEAVLALAFVGAGFSKLTASAEMVAAFDKIGLGEWFLYFTGGVEVLAGLALLLPVTARAAAAVLAVVMAAAAVTHWTILGGAGAPALILLALLGVVLWQRSAAAPVARPREVRA